MDRMHAVANSYFRIGQEAMLIAMQRRRSEERSLGLDCQGSTVITNESDWAIVTNTLNLIDDPRVLQVVRELYGSTIGIDTNSWVNSTNSWLILSK